MNLSHDLISDFVKITKDDTTGKQETTVFGTTVEQEGKMYVQFDGSDRLTPVVSTADTLPGERVVVMIKNHTATITGNLSSPAARTGDMQLKADAEVVEAENVRITGVLSAETARIDDLIADNVKINDTLAAETARINTIVTDNVEIRSTLTATSADISTLKANDVIINGNLSSHAASIQQLTTDKLNAHEASITYATIDRMETVEAEIVKLEAGGITTEQLEAQFANINFSNITQAAMEYFYAQSGLIDNVIIGDGTITGTLVGVTITGDLIQANTIVADRLVMLGEDGIYYKLNTDGMTIGADQTEHNSLNGQVIMAKSITAEKVNVNDLVAFDATIGGFSISDTAIYSEVKDSSDNYTRGIYFDVDGQVNIGDATNFIKYIRDDNGDYHLTISADTILYDINGNQRSIADLGVIGEYIHITTYNDKPCIELGESDSDFKLLITNTEIVFMEGSDVPAYFSNQSLYIKKAVIEEELQHGQFVWKTRDNGNLGLMWVGGDS